MQPHYRCANLDFRVALKTATCEPSEREYGKSPLPQTEGTVCRLAINLILWVFPHAGMSPSGGRLAASP